MEKQISYQELKITTPYAIQKIKEVEINGAINEHLQLKITGILKEGAGAKCAKTATSQDLIEVDYEEAESAKSAKLFSGNLININVNHQNSIYYFEITALSKTHQLDDEIKTRAFQDAKTQNANIIAEILSTDETASYSQIPAKIALAPLIVQYQETDWQFLKRIAAHYQTVLIPNLTSNGPSFYLGIPGVAKKLGKVSASTIHQAPQVDHQASKTDHQASLANHQSPKTALNKYEITSETRLNLGDEVTFNNQNLIVEQLKFKMVAGLMQYNYLLAHQTSLTTVPTFNKKLSGIALLGEVIATQNQQVKLALNCDEKQDLAKANWFNYTALSNNILYSVPSIGTNVSLYFSNHHENSAVAINAIRKSAATHPKLTNPAIKKLDTKTGQQFNLGEKTLDLTAKPQLALQLDTGLGVKITSHDNIFLATGQKLLMQAGSKIKFQATNGNIIAATGASGKNAQALIMGEPIGDTHIGARGQVIYEARYKRAFTENLNQPIEYQKVVFSILRMLANIVIGLAVVAVIAVTAFATGGLTLAASAAVMGIVAVTTKTVKDVRSGRNSSLKRFALAGFRGAITGVLMKVVGGAKIFKGKGLLLTLGKGLAVGGTSFGIDAVFQGIDILFEGGSYNWFQGLTRFAFGFAMPFFCASIGALAKKLKGATGDFKTWLKKKTQSKPSGKKKCKGDPVDVIAGCMFIEATDFKLPGPIPLAWRRTWYSDSQLIGQLGHGMRHNFEMGLEVFEIGKIGVYLADGRGATFPKLLIGEAHNHPEEALTLTRQQAKSYRLFDQQTRISYHFEKIAGGFINYKLTQIVNQQQHKIQLAYNELGQLTTIIDSAGRYLSVTNNQAGKITKISLENLDLVRYQYNQTGDLIEITDALNQPTKLSYQNHLIVKKVDKNKHAFHWKYEHHTPGARVLETFGDDGELRVKFTYCDAEAYTQVSDINGISKYFYDERNLCTKIIYPDNTQTEEIYNEREQLVKTIDEAGKTTTYEYDQKSQITAIKFASGHTSTFEYDEAGNLTKTTDPEGGEINHLYNEDQTLKATIDENKAVIAYTYNEFALLETIIGAKAEMITFAYDKHHNLAQVTLPNDISSTWQYDNRGNCIKATNPLGEVTTYHYDDKNRLIETNLQDGNNLYLAYNAYHDVTKFKDNHSEIHMTYTALGQLKTQTQSDRKTEFTYDKNERLTGVINENGEAYTFTYDAKDNINEETTFDGITKTYEYGQTGQLTKVNRPENRWTTYEYDQMGNVIFIKNHDNTFDKFTYNKKGEMLSATNQHTTLKFELDQTGRIIKEWQGEHVITSTYNQHGIKTQVESSLGAKIAMNYNDLGELTQLVASQNGRPAWHQTISYNNFGQETLRKVSGGISNEFTYNPKGQLASHQVLNRQQAVRKQSYNWDAREKLTLITNELTKAQTKFSYDEFANLTMADYGFNEIIHRETDKVGNLYKMQDKSDRSYGKGSRLEQAGINTNELKNKYQGGHEKQITKGTTYTYDGEGNLIKQIAKNQATWQYEYYSSGMLAKVIKPDNQVVTFKYDSFGRRIEKEAAGNTVKFLWDQNNPLHEWASGEQSATLTTWLFKDDFIPTAKLTNQGNYSIITDYLGTPVEAYNEAGTKVWQQELDIYGKPRPQATMKNNGLIIDDNLYDDDFIPFRYQGQYSDKELGGKLYYNRFRYFEPELGTYITQDPIGLAGGNPTLYGYVPDPNTFVDPLGLFFLYVPEYAKEWTKILTEMKREGMLFVKHREKRLHWYYAKSNWDYINKLRTMTKDMIDVFRGAKILGKYSNVLIENLETELYLIDKLNRTWSPGRTKTENMLQKKRELEQAVITFRNDTKELVRKLKNAEKINDLFCTDF